MGSNCFNFISCTPVVISETSLLQNPNLLSLSFVEYIFGESLNYHVKIWQFEFGVLVIARVAECKMRLLMLGWYLMLKLLIYLF